MGLAGMDCFLPGPSRFVEYVNGPAEGHLYMAHIGAGEALARLRRSPERFLRRLDDPVVRWLVMDGFGFHEGFFRSTKYLRDQHPAPRALSPFARRVFDQGLGRAIWFREGADVERIEDAIAAFPLNRQPDLWVGVGVACGYVGNLNRGQIQSLQFAAGPYGLQLAVGAAFVARGRIRAGNPTADTDLACEVLCGGMSAAETSSMVEGEWKNLTDTPESPAYDVLQRRLAEAIWASQQLAELFPIELANRRSAA